MRKSLTSALLAVTLLGSILAAPAAAQGNSSSVELLSEDRIAWSRGASEWVNFMWTTDEAAADVQVRVTSATDGLEFEYPGDDDYSSLNVDADLDPNEMDYTAIRFATTSGGTKFAVIEVSWTDDDGDRRSTSTRVRFTNRRYQGEHFSILTEQVVATTDPANGQANWIDLEYKGIAPTNRDMRMSVEADVEVYHPQETFTSLHHDEVLHAGEIDVARVWLDPELLTPGLQRLTVTIDYVDSNGRSRSIAHEVAVSVA